MIYGTSLLASSDVSFTDKFINVKELHLENRMIINTHRPKNCFHRPSPRTSVNIVLSIMLVLSIIGVILHECLFLDEHVRYIRLPFCAQ